jgi:predicted RNA binding protein YcfA (HicA-like mRNA interferase family)
MGKFSKLKERILSGAADKNIDFRELCQLLIRLGFEQRIKGDHHIFVKDNVTEIINLQPNGGKAKFYQVKQVRSILTKYILGEADDDQI